MSFRNAAKRDANEPEVVMALQAAGWSIFQVGAAGFPDLVAVRHGVSHFLEVKSAKGELTPAQVKLHRRMAAAGLTVHVVRTAAEALAAVAPATLRPIARPVCGACSTGEHEKPWNKSCVCICHPEVSR